ncbi:MAG TPA: DUF3604 domain-containing protein [Myxococcota bacterium]|nr:DUF3604 domain-containing protein [Myxococcota bacterium]HRY92574.1 DUF3604 domain-containing protein [Myxococcota bacterium]HSA24182.1 DUF3604 domain-containing protein [Myxococcota bacterium]
MRKLPCLWLAVAWLGWAISACDSGGGAEDASDGFTQDGAADGDGDQGEDDSGVVDDDGGEVDDDSGQTEDDGGQGEDGSDPQTGDGTDAAIEDGDGDEPEDDGGPADDEGQAEDEGAVIGPLAGCVEGDFFPFHGDLHAHSTQSDGDDDPETAFLWARDEAHLDIFALTDHMEQFIWPLTEWGDCKDLADSFYAPGSFVALCGFEFATAWFGLSGHNNVFFSADLFNQLSDISGFYDQLAACDTCIGQFNHPGDSSGHNWNDFEFHAGAGRNLAMMEFNTDGDAWGMFFQALDVGWHLSPQYNTDRHGTYAGANYQRTSGFFLREATREELYDAMLHRRTFMSHDRNSSIALKAGSCWMGSRLSGVVTLPLTVEVQDDDAGEGFASVEFFGPSQQLIHTTDCAGANPCTATYDYLVVGRTFVVARATQADGDLLISAPIWAQP